MRRLIAIALLGGTLAACGGGNNTPPGQRPPATATPTTASAPATPPAGGATTPQPSPRPIPCARPQTYTVVAGDTLWDIAARFGTTVQAIAELNQIDDADALLIGQVLKLPGAASATPAPSPSPAASASPSVSPTQ